jgi:pimeloyl-ACP methyl ester carboxylesterase
MASITTATHRAVAHRRVTVDETDVFYRESGPDDAPVVLLLHGYPASSLQFDALMRELPQWRCLAPDLPAFGYTETPEDFEFTFDALAGVVEGFVDALGVERHALYLFDWGAPVGFRLALRRPERVSALIVQNGNAYKEGLSDRMAGLEAFWNNREAVEPRIRAIMSAEQLSSQYTEGSRHPDTIPPDFAVLDRHLLDRPGREQAVLDLFYDYRTNVEHYGAWQSWMRETQPPTLVVWGQNDPYFTVAGARAYLNDLPQAELHLLDTGHFALVEDGLDVARLMDDFLLRHSPGAPSAETHNGKQEAGA